MAGFKGALGESPAMLALGERLQRIVSAGTRRLPPVLIEGETGTGKSFLAATLHRGSARASEPFVSVNCAAIPRELLEAELFGYERGAFTGASGTKPGLFQIASGGTLFLDEIGFLGESLQAKLLTVLEERSVRRLGATRNDSVDLWIMAATNSDLRRTSREGGFLEALFHRLAVVTVQLPPLRERGDDVIALAEKLLARACAQYELAPKLLADDARAALRSYPFPGNVRELGNIMERVALLQSSQVVSHAMLELPCDGALADGPPSTSDDPAILTAALQANDWNISRAAAHLGLPRSTLRSRIRRHGLSQKVGASAPAPSLSTSIPPGPQRIAVLEIVPGHPASHLVSASVQLAAEKARAFGAHATSTSPTSTRALFRLDRFEDGARTAVAAARAIERAIAALNENEYRLLIHVGRFVADEEVDGAIPSTSQIAELPAGLVVSDAAAGLLRRQVEIEPLGAGWNRVLAIATFAGERGCGLAALVGRTLEVALVQQRLEAAKEGQGQLVGIQGDAGIGKSRLVAEAVRASRTLGFTHLEGACLAHGKTMPYLPIIEIVRALCGVTERDDALQLAAKIDGSLDRLGVGADYGPPLLRLLGVTDLDPSASPEGTQAQIRNAVVSLVLAAARETPLFLVCEDVQWLDGASRDVLSALAQEVLASSIAFVATYRSGSSPPWMSRPQATQLSLLPLSQDEAVHMASEIGGAAASTETVAAIVKRADGNPFFIEELSLTFGAGRILPASGLPESIVDVVSSRIFALGNGARRVLVTVSVAGRTCPLGLLRDLLPVDLDLEACLEELARVELVYSKVRDGERQLVFRHVVTQEVAYGLLSASERRTLHGSAARAIEAAHAERHDDVIELLAHHHARGDDPERAVDVLTRAVVKAVSTNVVDAARARYDEAMRILDSLPATFENRRRRMKLLVGEHAVPLFFLRLQVDEYLATLEQLEPEARSFSDSAMLGMLYARKGHCLWWVGRFDEAVVAGERALERFEALAMPALAVHTFMMNALYAKGAYHDIMRREQRVLEVVERERHPRWSAYVLGVLAWAHARLGHRERAVAIGERVLEFASARADASVSSFARWSLAIVLADVGEPEQALGHAQRAVEEAPTPADRVWAECVRAGIQCRHPDHAAHGTTTLHGLVSELRRSKQLAAEDLFVPALGEGYVRLGRLAEGRRVFEEVLAHAERHGMRYVEASACGWLAEIARRSGQSSANQLRERADRVFTELAVPHRGSPHARVNDLAAPIRLST